MKGKLIMGFAVAMLLVAMPSMVYGGGMSAHGDMGVMFGGFNYSSGYANGTFVDFKIDPATGEVSNYEVNSTVVFKSVEYENSTTGKITVKGPVIWYYGVGTKINWSNHNPGFESMWRFIHIHDNPAAVFHIVVYGEDTITYTLGDGITADKVGNHTIELSGAMNGALIYTGKARIENGKIMITLGDRNYEFGNYTYRGGSVIFIRTHAWKFSERVRNKIMAAIAEGKMGGEIRISGSGEDFVNYTYGFHAKVEMHEKNRIRLRVDSDNHEGKVMMITVNREDLQYDENHRIVVKLDGKELKYTSDSEVLAGGNEGKYTVINGTSEVTVLVYIPHFSEHEVDVSSEPKSISTEIMGNPMYMGAIIAVILLVIIAIVAIIKRR